MKVATAPSISSFGVLGVPRERINEKSQPRVEVSLLVTGVDFLQFHGITEVLRPVRPSRCDSIRPFSSKEAKGQLAVTIFDEFVILTVVWHLTAHNDV
jgi:hypothetical protein